jgi:ligand-binding sensor domain-containing protein
VGTRFSGAVMLSETAGKWTAKTFDHHQGLLSNWVACFAENDNDEIWLSTLTGINKLTRKDSSFSIFNYSRITNFFSDVNSIVTYGNDNVWCASNKGLIFIKDEKLETRPPLPVYITTAQLGT